MLTSKFRYVSIEPMRNRAPKTKVLTIRSAESRIMRAVSLLGLASLIALLLISQGAGSG